MKVIHGAAYMEASDFHAIKTGLFLRKVLRKAGRILTMAFVQGAMIAGGLFVGLKVLGAIYLK